MLIVVKLLMVYPLCGGSSSVLDYMTQLRKTLTNLRKLGWKDQIAFWWGKYGTHDVYENNYDDADEDDNHLKYLGKLLLILNHDQVGSAVGKHIPVIISIVTFIPVIMIITTIIVAIITIIMITTSLTITCTPLQSLLDRYRKRDPRQTRTQCLKHSLISPR